MEADRNADTPRVLARPPLSWPPTALLGGVLVLSTLLCVYGIVAIWPAVDAATSSNMTARVTLLGWSFRPSTEGVLLLLVAICGALGGNLHGLISFADYTGNRRLFPSWVWWYLLREVVGLTVALVTYFLVRGLAGLFGADTPAQVGNPFAIAAAAAVVALLSKQIMDKVREFADAALRHSPFRDEQQHIRAVFDSLFEFPLERRWLSASDEWRGLAEQTVDIQRRATESALMWELREARWNRIRYFIGLPATVLASLAAATAFGKYPVLAGSLATAAGALMALQTFLNPPESATIAAQQAADLRQIADRAQMTRRVVLVDAHEDFVHSGGDSNGRERFLAEGRQAVEALVGDFHRAARPRGATAGAALPDHSGTDAPSHEHRDAES